MSVERVATESFERALRALLEQSGGSNAEALERVSKECDVAFEAFQTARPTAGELERVRCLHALASSNASQQLAAVARRLELARAARRALAGDATTSAGEGCDCAA